MIGKTFYKSSLTSTVYTIFVFRVKSLKRLDKSNSESAIRLFYRQHSDLYKRYGKEIHWKVGNTLKSKKIRLPNHQWIICHLSYYCSVSVKQILRCHFTKCIKIMLMIEEWLITIIKKHILNYYPKIVKMIFYICLTVRVCVKTYITYKEKRIHRLRSAVWCKNSVIAAWQAISA